MTCYQCGFPIYPGADFLTLYYELRPLTLVKGNRRLVRFLRLAPRQVHLCVFCTDFDGPPDSIDSPRRDSPA